MEPMFKERIENVESAISWGNILPTAKESGTVDCPFCGKKGKAYLYPNYFKCFSSRCGVKGGKTKIYSMREGLRFIEALETLEGKAGLSRSKVDEDFEKRSLLLSEVLDAYEDKLETYPEVIEYLQGRGFDEEFIRLMRIGYAPHNTTLAPYDINRNALIRHRLLKPNGQEFFWQRIIFPIYNSNGRLVHLTGRQFPTINDEYKYLDSPEVPIIGSSKKYLLFEDQIDFYKNSSDTIYLVEGVPDAFTLKQLGYPVVGVLGLAKLMYHTSKFKGFKKLIAVFDNDRYEYDHPMYPSELKSWRMVMSQLIDLQLYMGKELQVQVCMVPEHLRTTEGPVKDINDVYTHGYDVEEVLSENTEDLVEHFIKTKGGNYANHEMALKLISTTGRCANILDDYITDDMSPIEYALKVLAS